MVWWCSSSIEAVVLSAAGRARRSGDIGDTAASYGAPYRKSKSLHAGPLQRALTRSLASGFERGFDSRAGGGGTGRLSPSQRRPTQPLEPGWWLPRAHGAVAVAANDIG